MHHGRNVDVEVSAAALANILESFDIALICLDPDGRICFMNRLAESLLRTSHALSIRQGRIACANTQASAELNKVLMETCSQTSHGLLRASITVPYDHRSMYVTALPIRGRSMHSSRSRVLLTVTDVRNSPNSREQILAELFHLTPAEIRVAMLLLAGLDPKEISHHTGATLNTVRFQLKAIYRKTGTARQSQLVRLVSILPGQPESLPSPPRRKTFLHH